MFDPIAIMTDQIGECTVMDLQADTVQGVIFAAPGSQQEDALKLWAILFPGDSPDGFQKSGAGPNLNSSASGDRDGFLVNVTAKVGRVDIVLSPTLPVQTSAIGGPPRIEDVLGASEWLRRRLQTVIKSITAIRIALVIDAAATIELGHESGAMNTLLGGMQLPPASNEIVFQFNSRRNFTGSPEITMNRICAFTTGQVGFVAGGPGVHAATTLQLTPFIGMKIDVNSAPENRLPASQVSVVIDEVALEVAEIFNRRLARFY